MSVDTVDSACANSSAPPASRRSWRMCASIWSGSKASSCGRFDMLKLYGSKFARVRRENAKNRVLKTINIKWRSTARRPSSLAARARRTSRPAPYLALPRRPRGR